MNRVVLPVELDPVGFVHRYRGEGTTTVCRIDWRGHVPAFVDKEADCPGCLLEFYDPTPEDSTAEAKELVDK